MINSKVNQNLALTQNVPKYLTNLLKTRNVTVQLNTALAFESLAKRNNKLSHYLIELGAAESMIMLLKVCLML